MEMEMNEKEFKYIVDRKRERMSDDQWLLNKMVKFVKL